MASTDWTRTPITRIGGPFTRTVSAFCRPCNNGWMSRLETSARPVLTSLIDAADGTCIVLDRDQQLILARWAYKTLIVACAIDGAERVPREHIQEFYGEVDPPATCWIRIGRSAMSINPQHGEHLGGVSFEPRTARIHDGSSIRELAVYQARIRLLGVAFDVFGSPVAADGLALEPQASPELVRALVPIWPVTHEQLSWPPATSVDVLSASDSGTQTDLRG
ncbi:hypothetical protein [Actinomycetospora soli]|uniref:hypothetical protein n=1 Tax=Actinomycetospora soli TaxID=2893887 RepID=UPI001E2C07C3|nr:hypothetical protein [Actinomycetospora soli]MCD2191620.1 hypothetical protein [Actinomycetospora soli]